ncbi:hypothetical protein LTR41_011624 [Exophiala xenobiotica]|nr:hypothetical protein LTR41_011624 [Exophiala xenobiotica]KAK5550516.1 hypothetical protein LTR46_011476 [Exophiala xenobiotica]
MSLETVGQELSLIRPWHERTRWYETYRDRPRDVLYWLAQLPNRGSQMYGIRLGTVGDQELWSSAEDEKGIHRILQHVDIAFDRCEETVRRTGHPILCWLRSRFPSRPFKAPFQLVGRDETRRKYRRRWRQVLAVGLRSVRFQPSVIRALGIPLTTPQITVVRQLWSIISSQPELRLNRLEIEVDGDKEDSEEGEGDGDDDGDDADEDNEGHEDDDYILDDRAEDASLSMPLVDNHNTGSDIISELIFKLSILFCRDEFTDGQPSFSALVYISGILAITTDGAGFQTPRLYTPTISALIHLQLLLFLEESLPYRQYLHLRIPARPGRDHLEILNSVRCRYMCAGSLTPLGEMISLPDYGRSMLRSEPPSFFVRWSDDRQTIFFDDHSLRMDRFRGFARSLSNSAADLYDQLMRQWQPEVSLEGIRDSFSNDTPGYSFVYDPANRLNDAYLQLSTKVCGMGSDALIQNGEWDLPAVIEYLQLHDGGLHALGQTMAINDGGCLVSRLLDGPLIAIGQLISAFRHSSNQYIGFPLGSRLLRQVTIAITETHVRENSRPFNRYDDYSADDPADVAFSWQSGHRPRVRASNYGRDGAFSHIVDATLLEAYRKVSSRWHNFLGVSSPCTKIVPRTPPMNHVSGRDQIVSSSTLLPQNICARQGVTRTPLGKININRASTSQRHSHSTASVSSTTERPGVGIQPPKNYQYPEVEAQARTESCRKQDPSSTQVRRAGVQCRIGLASLNQGHYTSQEAFNSLFIHLPQYRIIICDACPEPFAVVPGHVETHIGKHHLHIPIHARKGIEQYVKTLAHLAHRPEDVIRPSITGGHIQALPVFDEGMGYWVAQPILPSADLAPRTVDTDSTSPRRRRHIQQLHQDEQSRLHQQPPPNSAITFEPVESDNLSTWLRRTRWVETYADTHRELLIGLYQTPRGSRQDRFLARVDGDDLYSSPHDERRLREISHACDRLFRRCEETATATDTGLRHWLTSHNPHRPYRYPFELPTLDTRRKYYWVWKRFLFFVFRFYRLNARIQQHHVQFRLTKTQRQAIRQVWDLGNFTSDADMDNLEAGEDDDGHQTASLDDIQDDGNDHDEEQDNSEDFGSDLDGEDSEDGDLDPMELNAEEAEEEDSDQEGRAREEDPQDLTPPLDDLLLRLSLTLIEDELTDGRPASTLLVFFVGVLGFSSDGPGFRRPGNYTSYLSAASWLALPPTTPTASEIPTLPSSTPLLRKFDTGGGDPESSRVWTEDLADTGCGFKFFWSDDGQTVTWDQQTYTITLFRKLSQQALDMASQRTQRLMYNWQPEMDLGQIRDRFTNLEEGYSFLVEPHNGLREAYLLLSDRACAADVDGLMTSDGWDLAAVGRYLAEEELLRQELILLVYLFGGQAPRYTDLLRATYANGPTQSRSVYVHDGTVVFVTSSCKSSRSTQSDFHCARYLPAPVAAIWFQYLVYIRPILEDRVFLQHGWTNVQKRGGNTRGGQGVRQQQTPNRMWVEQPFGQQFFRVDKWKKIFPVAAHQQDWVQVDEIVFRDERQLAAQVKAIEEFQQHKEIGYVENRYEANGWLERTGWVSHLAQYTRDELEKFVVMLGHAACHSTPHSLRCRSQSHCNPWQLHGVN